jgi:hypothetical protein
MAREWPEGRLLWVLLLRQLSLVEVAAVEQLPSLGLVPSEQMVLSTGCLTLLLPSQVTFLPSQSFLLSFSNLFFTSAHLPAP